MSLRQSRGPVAIEQRARSLAAMVLHDPLWRERLDALCDSLHRAAGQIAPAARMAAVVRRAEAILRDIADLDAASVGRLYFDLLPRQPDHPLTEAVAAALADRKVVLAMLRDAGIRPRLLKDDDGTTFIVLDGLDEARDLSEGLKRAIRIAMTAPSRPPCGALHRLH